VKDVTSPLRPLPSPAAGSRRGLSVLGVVVLGVAAIFALNLLIIAAFIGGQGDEGPSLPVEIEDVTPAPNSVIRPQEDVGADLDDTYTGVLLIDDVEIPLDQLQVVPPLGQVIFRPGEGKEISRLAPGPHRATIEYWPQNKTREEAARSFTWQFTAG
jgi:hypothetical protein